MPKVLHFFKTYCPDTMGGIEQVIFQLVEGCLSHGIESEVLYLSERGSARGETVGHHLAHRAKLDFHLASTGFSISVFKDFVELARQADIIHYHFPWPFMDLLHFAAKVRKPTVVSYHSDIVKQKFLLKLYQPLMNRFLGSVDRIVAASPNYVTSSPVLHRFRDKVSVIPYGLDEATYVKPPVDKLAYWRSRFGDRFFLFVGALRYYKGLSYLLEAAKGCDFPIVILGIGPLDEELRTQAEKLALDNVHFLGGLPDEDKNALLSLCRGVVFPSHLRSEAFGITLLEGAMYGKPLISCEIGTGTSFINMADETGLVIPPADPYALRDAMRILVAQPELAGEMGRKARLRFESIFTAELMASRYAALYRSIL